MIKIPLTHVSLFSGIGGIDLAAEWAGFKSVLQVEMAEYPRAVLTKHWPDVPKIEDVRNVTKDTYRKLCGEQRPTLLSGGFPCQPFSCAGKRRGAEDDRYLWPQMLRVVQELRPAWVLGENVAGFVGMVLDDALADLEGAGYSCRAFLLPACGVGAWHRRDRCFIIATDTDNAATSRQREHGGEILPLSKPEGSSICSIQLSNSDIERFPTQRIEGGIREEEKKACPGIKRRCMLGQERDTTTWESEPAVGRVAHGVPRRVDRLRALGNAVVPQQVYPILKAIATLEKNYKFDVLSSKSSISYL